MHDGLGDQHPIEWVRVEWRQFGGVKRGILVDVERVNPARVAHHGDQDIRTFRQGEPAGSVLDANLPGDEALR